MDKASVLGNAIKYLKQLEERVKTLEEQVRKKPIESVVFVKKHEVCGDGEISSSDENFSGGPYDEPLPQIEAKICDKDVLIRVHCKKRKGVLEKTVEEIEKLKSISCQLQFHDFWKVLWKALINKREREQHSPFTILFRYSRIGEQENEIVRNSITQ
ncbi:hypothetical protein ACSBR1_040673 [Camellia fascicularis]